MHHFLQLRNDSAYHHRFPTPPAKSPSPTRRTHHTHHAHPHLHTAVLPRQPKIRHVPHAPQSSPAGNPSSNRKQQSPHDTQSPSAGKVWRDVGRHPGHPYPRSCPRASPSAAESTGMDAYVPPCRTHPLPATESPARHQHTTNTPPAPQRHLTGIPNPSNRGRL